MRAFGLAGTRAMIADKWHHIRQASGWTENHTYQPGSVVCSCEASLVIAASDGYIALLEWWVAAQT